MIVPQMPIKYNKAIPKTPKAGRMSCQKRVSPIAPKGPITRVLKTDMGRLSSQFFKSACSSRLAMAPKA